MPYTKMKVRANMVDPPWLIQLRCGRGVNTPRARDMKVHGKILREDPEARLPRRRAASVLPPGAAPRFSRSLPQTAARAARGARGVPGYLARTHRPRGRARRGCP